jgi:hypothetical protein
VIAALDCAGCGVKARINPPDGAYGWWHVGCFNHEIMRHYKMTGGKTTELRAVRLWNKRQRRLAVRIRAAEMK